MTRDEFVKLLEERGEVVWIVDRGLIRFAKFAATILAIFASIGVFFFGLDINKASYEAKEARFETEKTLREVDERKKELNAAREQIQALRTDFQAYVAKTRDEINAQMLAINESRTRAFGIIQEMIVFQQKTVELGDPKAAAAVLASIKAESALGTGSLSVSASVRVGFVSEVSELTFDDLKTVAAALQTQVRRDLMPVWKVNATIEVFKSLDSVPNGVWPVIIKRDIGFEGAGGIHLYRDGAAFAMVAYTSDRSWTISASHELIDMLVDPQGNRTLSAPSPNPADNGKLVDILVEPAQPVQGAKRAYKIDQVLVSDFVTPAFYTSAKKEDLQYSYGRSVKEPRSVLQDGYLSWLDPATKEVHQVTWFNELKYRNLGKIN
jgi:hypothetical protein